MKLGDAAMDAVAITIANKSMGTGAAASVLGWLASVNWLGVSGVVIALAGLIANIYFQRRRDRRETAESRARIAALKERL